MIHASDTHFWLGRTPDGWISQEETDTTADPAFGQVDKIRIEPLCQGSYPVILEAEKPEGYKLFFRHRFHDCLGEIIGVEYLIAAERGGWCPKEAATIDIDDFPIVDGFRAKLDLTGEVDFESSPNFTFIKSSEDGRDKYTFVRR